MGAYVVLALALALRGPAAADDRTGAIPVRLPAGTRTNAAGQLVSGAGLRDTTDAIARDLARQGIAVTQIGPYRVRGVELTRFVSLEPTTRWLAIHVLRVDGKTVISFVPRPNA